MQTLLESRGKKPRTGVVKQCDECGADYYAPPRRAESARFCSTKCRNASVYRQGEKICQTCGKAFTLGGITRKYCSFRCYQAKRVPRKNCKLCGAPLTVNRAVYCSWACRDKGRTTRLNKKCEECGATFSHCKGDTERRFCSKQCANTGHSLKGPGARRKRVDGYIGVYYPTHPDAASHGYILEHRLVMEQVIGRRLTKDEQVHHINSVRDDNRPENLQLLDARAHSAITIKRENDKRKSERDELEEYRKRFGALTEP